MNNKSVEYPLRDGGSVIISYDPEEPCINCGLPVIKPSMGGINICPSCDMGKFRDGTRMPFVLDERGLAQMREQAAQIWARIQNPCPHCGGSGVNQEGGD